MQTIPQDLRYVGRMLATHKGFSAVAILSVALGIGANSAIFSVVNTVLLRPLPYRDPGELVLVRERFPKSELGSTLVPVCAAEFVDYRNGNSALESIAGFESITKNMTGRGAPERIKAARVSASTFSILGVTPTMGRTFTPEEDQPGKEDVVVLSDGLWRRVFGADPSVLGKTIKLSDRPYSIIGIMPENFRFPQPGTAYADNAELWVPLALSSEEINDRGSIFNINLVGRLKSGISPRQAESSVDAIANEFQERLPDLYKNEGQLQAVVVSLAEEVAGKPRPFLLILLVSAGLVLLLACANVGNLLLARAATRRREIAIRTAVGAGSFRIIRQLLTESIFLGLLGGALGLLLAELGATFITRFGPEAIPRLREVSIDWRVLGFTALLSTVSGILFGLAPAIQCLKVNTVEALKEAGKRGSEGRAANRFRGALIVLETAGAVVLLAGAGLLINSFIRVLAVRPGFNPENTLVASTALAQEGYPKAELQRAVQGRLLEKIAVIPGVKAAGAASHLPLTYGWNIGFTVEGFENGSKLFSADNNLVSNDYFRAMGIQLLRGRTFSDQDKEGAQPAIIVNETMARRFWPEMDPIGRRIKWGANDPASPWLTIVGQVADVKVSALDAETRPQVYMPFGQQTGPGGPIFLVVRSEGEAGNLISEMRAAIWSVDPDLPIYDVRSMGQILAESIAERRFLVSMLAAFAALALTLAVVGLYGVISYSIAQRTREIGIRMALGADRRDVLKLTMGKGMAPALIGVITGLATACWPTPLAKSMLFGVSANDPLTLGGASLLVIAAAFVSSFLPARRAIGANPMKSLRYD
jgi:predicted permease